MEASLSSRWFGSRPWFSPITFGGLQSPDRWGIFLSLHFVSITQGKKKEKEALCNLGSPVPVNDNIL